MVNDLAFWVIKVRQLGVALQNEENAREEVRRFTDVCFSETDCHSSLSISDHNRVIASGEGIHCFRGLCSRDPSHWRAFPTTSSSLTMMVAACLSDFLTDYLGIGFAGENSEIVLRGLTDGFWNRIAIALAPMRTASCMTVAMQNYVNIACRFIKRR